MLIDRKSPYTFQGTMTGWTVFQSGSTGTDPLRTGPVSDVSCYTERPDR